VIQSLNDLGHAPVIRSADHAIDLATRPSSVPEEVSNYYFTGDALNNIRRELTQAAASAKRRS
jgi:hypothetical protein